MVIHIYNLSVWKVGGRRIDQGPSLVTYQAIMRPYLKSLKINKLEDPIPTVFFPKGIVWNRTGSQ